MAKRILVNVNGTLRNVKRILVNVNGTLRNVKSGLVNVNGVLRQFFTSSVTPSIEQTVQLTKSSSVNADYHNSTYPVTLTGRKYHFRDASVFSYRFYRSADQVNWTPMTSETITTNPSSGSSSTVTYQLQNTDFTSTTMYFKFEYTATNTTYSTTATSTSNIVSVMYLEIPAPPLNFPNINQSTISVASTASSGTWTGSPILYEWKWQYGPSNTTLTFQANKSISSISLSGTTATVTVFDHGYKSGDLVSFSGINSLFNQSFSTISSVFTNFFSYTVVKPAFSFSSNYSVNDFVTFNGIIYKSLLATPTPRPSWNSTTSYSTGQYVNYNGDVWQATGPNINQTPINGSDFWQLINIYPTSTTYWQSQNGQTASNGTTTGPNYYEGSSSSPISYTIPSFPATDYKTGTSLQGLTTRMNVSAYNAATFSNSANSSLRTIYGYPVINLGTRSLTSTTASIPYTESNMDVYDIDVKIGPAYTTSVSGFPKTNQSNSSPILISGLSGGTAYIAYVTPKNADSPRVSGQQKTDSFTVPITPTASGFSHSDVTTTPSQPSTISFSSSNNQVTSSWTNGSPITSVTYTYSGAGTNGSLTDTDSPFVTSDVTAYSQSGTYTFTVTNFNNNLVARVSWNQTNAQSYRISYSGSLIGGQSLDGNSSASTVTVDIPWSTSYGNFTFTGLTVYSSTSQQGNSSSYSTGLGAISVSTKSSSRSGSVALTYTPPAPVNTSIPTLSPTTITIGTQLTAGVGTWSNSPTSYDLRIYRGTQNVATFETLVASTTSTSLNYTVTQADYDSGQRYFRAFASASNAGGSSGLVAGQERGPIQISAPVNTAAPSVTPSSGTAGVTQFSSTTGSWSNSPTSYAYQWQYLDQGTTYLNISGATSSTYTPPSNYVSLYGSSLRCRVTATNAGGSNSANSNVVTVSAGGGGSAPATPTNVGLTGSGVVSWTASSGATSYEIEFYTAQSSTGLNAAGPYTVTGISSSPYQLVSPYASPNNWARVRVRARNSNGASAYSAWVPSATTYT